MKPHLNIFSLFEIEVYWLIVSLAFLIGIFYFFKRTKGVRSLAMTLSFMLFSGGLLGGRLYHVIYEVPWFYKDRPFYVFYIWDGGFGFFGGLIGGLLACLLFCSLKKEPFLFWADKLSLPVSLGCGIGRLACFFHGCCYGMYCNFPWAVQFEFSPYSRHPTQLYSSFSELCLLSFLLFLEKHKKPKQGVLFFSWLLGHCLLRILIEPFRDDYRGPALAFGLKAPSWISLHFILLSLVALCYLVFFHKKNKKVN